MHPLLSKTSRTGLMYVALCAVALAVAQRWRLAQCTDVRDGVIRELSLDPAPADVLFLGSSQTARGVIPAVFEERYAELAGRQLHSVNLAPFGAGRHIGFLELSRWLERHPAPSIVVVEVGVTSDLVEYPHAVLARFMDLRDARRVVRYAPYVARDAKEFGRRLASPPLVDPLRIFSTLDRRALHVELALDVLGRGPEDCVRTVFDELVSGGSPYWRPAAGELGDAIAAAVAEGGYYRVTPDSALGIEGQAKVEQRNQQISYEDALALAWDPAEDDFADPRRYRPAKLYAAWIADVCRARDIQLVFADQPNYRGRPLRPSQIELYRSLGQLFLPDREVLYRAECFQDAGHLSVRGAEFYSRSLAEYLVLPRPPR